MLKAIQDEEKEVGSKLSKLDSIKEFVKDGISIGIGGFSLNNSPMTLIREIIRIGVVDLTIIAPLPQGIQIDILVGAGCVKKVIAPAVGLESFGPAPNFVRAIRKGTIEFVACDLGFTTFGLRAAAENLPFYPYPLGVIEDSDLLVSNKDYRKIFDPFHEKEVVVVPPIKPDLALIHVQSADASGNCVHVGAWAADELLAEASNRTIVSADEIVPKEWLRQNPMKTSIPRHFVTGIVESPFATHPCASHSTYRLDERHFLQYVNAAQSDSSFAEYLQKYIIGVKDHFGYLRAVGGNEYLDRLRLK